MHEVEVDLADDRFGVAHDPSLVSAWVRPIPGISRCSAFDTPRYIALIGSTFSNAAKNSPTVWISRSR